MAVLAGVPASSVMDAAMTMDIVFLEIDEDKRNQLLLDFPYYSKLDIPAGVYENPQPIKSIGVMNELFTNKEQSEELIYIITKALFENLSELVEIHNIASQITVEGV